MSKLNVHPLSEPNVEEIRAIRAEMSARFGNDVRKLAAHLRELQEEYRDRIVPLPLQRDEESPGC